MKVGIVVDGDAESQALRSITRRVVVPGLQIIDPVFASMQPKATPSQIAQAAAATLEVLYGRGVEATIVLIDRENREECPGGWATKLQDAFSNLGFGSVDVVVKNRTFENWLVADPRAFRRQRGRYSVTDAFMRSVEPNKADNIADAEAAIKQICIGPSYHKRRDAVAIAGLQDPLTIASNSRSFRRLLRILKHPDYLNQSRRPV